MFRVAEHLEGIILFAEFPTSMVVQQMVEGSKYSEPLSAYFLINYELIH